MKKRIIILGTVLLALIAVAGIVLWLILSSRLVVSFSLEEKSQTSKVVCGDDKVNLFNRVTTYEVRDNTNIPKVDEGGLRGLVQDIKKDKSYQDNATCQTILFWSAYLTKNANEASTAFSQIEKLHEKGEFADNNINRLDTIASYKAIVDRMNSPAALEGTGGY